MNKSLKIFKDVYGRNGLAKYLYLTKGNIYFKQIGQNCERLILLKNNGINLIKLKKLCEVVKC